MKTEKKIITLKNGVKVEALAPVIVSASRATAIPAFYMDWPLRYLPHGCLYCYANSSPQITINNYYTNKSIGQTNHHCLSD